MNNNFNGGEAFLGITLNINDVQRSNYNNSSFKITNTGNKKIAQVVIDVSNALYPDTVFDPFGKAGDTISKALKIDKNGGTGVINPSNASYIGAGGKKGYEAIKLVFNEKDNGGFQPGETIGFSIDMDANSVAGTNKRQLDGGTSPKWDVGGVSGAELIGSTFTVTFTDGSKATGQLQGDKSQAGSQALASQNSPNLPVSLTVNGLGAGGVGTYNDDPQVIIKGAAGETARIVLTKGFIQPFNPYADFLQKQLDVLKGADFPANNAVEFQTVDVKLTGGNQDITKLFNFSGVSQYNFAGEDELPLGFVASIIDKGNKDLPLGSVTKPIYLKYSQQGSNSNSQQQQAPDLNLASFVTVAENKTQVLNINATDANGDREGNGLKYSITGGADRQAFEINPDNGALKFVKSPDFENPTDKGKNNIYDVEVSVTDSTNRSDKQLINVNVTDVNEVMGGGVNNNTNPLIIEAENINNFTGYRLENKGVASEGKLLSLIGKGKNEVGTASFSFQGASGEYNVILGTFDENDGNSTFEVSKNNNLIGAIDLNQNLGNNGATAKTKVERTIATAVAIAPGDNFTIKGMEVGKEHARFDFIKFIPVGNTDNVTTVTANDLNQPKPTVNNNNKAIRLEAEDADTLINYRQENIGAASGNKALSFIGQGENESGSVTFDFNGASDTYNLTIGTFDENDGVASFKVQHNDAETNRTTAIATLELDGNLGSNSANGKTFISPTVAFGINLTPGDSITVIGLENASEHARLDYLELISTDANI